MLVELLVTVLAMSSGSAEKESNTASRWIHPC